MPITTTEATATAQTILAQLGGNKFIAMTGAKNIMRHPDGALSLKFQMCRKANYMKITLNSLDTYDIEFGKIRQGKLAYTMTQPFWDVYSDQLQDIFTHYTGLNTHL
jgi:hypothetical protein